MFFDDELAIPWGLIIGTYGGHGASFIVIYVFFV